MPVFSPSRWMPFHFSYLSSYKSNWGCRYCAAVAITPLPTSCSAYWRYYRRPGQKLKRNAAFHVASSSHPNTQGGTKTSAAAGCLKHCTPSFLLTGKQMPSRFCIQVSCQRAAASCSSAEEQLEIPHMARSKSSWSSWMLLYQEPPPRALCMKPLLGNCIHSSAPASRVLLPSTFLRSSRQWSRQKCTLKRPSFFFCRTVSACSSLLPFHFA